MFRGYCKIKRLCRIGKIKKERREERHIRNKTKDSSYKEQAWIDGKLILEDHSGKDFSEEFTVSLRDRLFNMIRERQLKSKTPLEFVKYFRCFKDKLIILILKYNENVQFDYKYKYLKELLEIYWDEVILNNNLEALWNYDR